MDVFRQLSLMLVFSLLVSCGAGGSSSGSGIGGTGITLVQGNVSSVNGQLLVELTPTNPETTLDYLSEWVIPVSYAQPAPIKLTVSGGGQSTSVDVGGNFALPHVIPSANFILTFTTEDRQNIPLSIGQVVNGSVVTVNNISLDTKKKKAEVEDIEVKEPEDNRDNNALDDGSDDTAENAQQAENQDDDSVIEEPDSPDTEDSNNSEDPPQDQEDNPDSEDPPEQEDPPETDN